MDGVAFVGHDFKTFVQVAIDLFNHHRIVVVARENVAIDLQQLQRFSANAVKFAVLVQNNGMTELVAKLNAHYCRGKNFRIGMLDWFHGGEAGHTTARNQINLKTIKARMLSGRVCVCLCFWPPVTTGLL